MAKFGFDYQVDVENTENQGGDFTLLPDMYARLELSAAEVVDTKDNRGKEARLVIDILEPEEFKGRKLWAYWTIRHDDGIANNKAFAYGKSQFDRLLRAIGVPDPQDTDDIVFKSFVAKVGTKAATPNPAGGTYKAKNEIKHWFYPDDDAKEPIPEVGLIDSNTQTANDNRASANDNKPAPSTARTTQNGGSAATKPAGARPWGKKAS